MLETVRRCSCVGSLGITVHGRAERGSSESHGRNALCPLSTGVNSRMLLFSYDFALRNVMGLALSSRAYIFRERTD